MNINSSRQTPSLVKPNPATGHRQAYKDSLDVFNDIAPEANDRYHGRSALVTNLTPIPAAVGLIGGTAAIWHYGEPVLDKILEAVHPAIGVPIAIVGTFGPMVAGIYGTMKATQFLHDKVTYDPKFESIKTDHSKVREDYRTELLKSANDEGVEAISNPQWTRLKNADTDYYYVGGPVGKEISLNNHVNDLEWLLDMRQRDDWRGDIAREQDDPAVARRMIREEAQKP